MKLTKFRDFPILISRNIKDVMFLDRDEREVVYERVSGGQKKRFSGSPEGRF